MRRKHKIIIFHYITLLQYKNAHKSACNNTKHWTKDIRLVFFFCLYIVFRFENENSLVRILMLHVQYMFEHLAITITIHFWLIWSTQNGWSFTHSHTNSPCERKLEYESKAAVCFCRSHMKTFFMSSFIAILSLLLIIFCGAVSFFYCPWCVSTDPSSASAGRDLQTSCTVLYKRDQRSASQM